jgi:hypothetical protein
MCNVTLGSRQCHLERRERRLGRLRDHGPSSDGRRVRTSEISSVVWRGRHIEVTYTVGDPDRLESLRESRKSGVCDAFGPTSL